MTITALMLVCACRQLIMLSYIFFFLVVQFMKLKTFIAEGPSNAELQFKTLQVNNLAQI